MEQKHIDEGVVHAQTQAGVIALLAQRAADTALEIRKGEYLDAAPFIVTRDAAGNEKVEYLNGAVSIPARKTGIITVYDMASFVAYVQLHGISTPIYAMPSPASFTTILNDHAADKAGHRDFRAQFLLAHSDEWTAWISKNGAAKKFTGTESFAQFLEENAADIIEPDPAKFLDLANNFHVNERVHYSKSQRLENGEVQFTFNKIVDGATTGGQGGAIKMPTKFKISIPVFKGIGQPKYEIEAHFRFRVGSGGTLDIWYDLIRSNKVVELAFKTIWDSVATQTKVPVLFGKPE